MEILMHFWGCQDEKMQTLEHFLGCQAGSDSIFNIGKSLDLEIYSQRPKFAVSWNFLIRTWFASDSLPNLGKSTNLEIHSPRPKFIISWKDLDEKMIWSWQPTISSKINGSGDLQPETQFLQFITRILIKAWYFSFFSDPFSQENHRTIYVLKQIHMKTK